VSTVTRESVRTALPQTGRGDAIFAWLALVVSVLAAVAKISGIA
jgi:LPXTG-motif cell wall-anchored protein